MFNLDHTKEIYIAHALLFDVLLALCRLQSLFRNTNTKVWFALSFSFCPCFFFKNNQKKIEKKENACSYSFTLSLPPTFIHSSKKKRDFELYISSTVNWTISAFLRVLKWISSLSPPIRRFFWARWKIWYTTVVF